MNIIDMLSVKKLEIVELRQMKTVRFSMCFAILKQQCRQENGSRNTYPRSISWDIRELIIVMTVLELPIVFAFAI